MTFNLDKSMKTFRARKLVHQENINLEEECDVEELGEEGVYKYPEIDYW